MRWTHGNETEIRIWKQMIVIWCQAPSVNSFGVPEDREECLSYVSGSLNTLPNVRYIVLWGPAYVLKKLVRNHQLLLTICVGGNIVMSYDEQIWWIFQKLLFMRIISLTCVFWNFKAVHSRLLRISICAHVHNRIGEADLKFVLMKNVHIFLVFQTFYVYFESL